MLLDNQKKVDAVKKKPISVKEYVEKYIAEGNIDIVTGYFNVGALAFLAEISNDKIDNFRLIIGELVKDETTQKQILGLLNEDLSIENALKTRVNAKKSVAFLQQQKVDVKILEPNFCHAKLYLQEAKNEIANFYISGSSNLTNSGIGLNASHSNIELNLAGTGESDPFPALKSWFQDLWEKPQAYREKTIQKGRQKVKINYKQYLIDNISKLFEALTPEQIYHKILFELFHQEENDPLFDRDFGRLEDTKIYTALYDFQKSGVRTVIKMLEKHNGAILADAVGLGKTWSALAVMKYYQRKGEVILICPKKLEQNWNQYLKKGNSRFEDDAFDFEMRFHTDLREGGMEKKQVTLDYFTSDRAKLIVIDESHNLRNDKSSRYQFLVNEILQQSKGDIKVLLLSATPINNSFKDVRNQFKLMVRGENDGFMETLDVKNLEYSFKQVQNVFNEWTSEEKATMSSFYARIKDSDFFRLTDSLVVARTRKGIKDIQTNLVFPKHKKPINICETPLKFGDNEDFEELITRLKLNLSAYQPSYYTVSVEERKWKKKEKEDKKKKGIKADKNEVLEDDVQREFFLVKMMNILMLKRLESSWYSFNVTVQRIFDHHKNALEKIEDYEKDKKNAKVFFDEDLQSNIIDDDDLQQLELFSFGKREIKLIDIDDAGMLKAFKQDIKKDKRALTSILDDLSVFAKRIEKERNNTTEDVKLRELLKIINEKQQQPNKKIIIFTAYKDTAEYLFEELGKRSFKAFAMVSGDTNKEYGFNNAGRVLNNASVSSILEKFAPFTKLFNEKEWRNFEPSENAKTPSQKYEEWKTWINQNEPKVAAQLKNPIDILIATDVLSEGQNLQDADMVINYDIHWNPVRVIQRVGRIDRIGSPNDTVQCINFWPSESIDNYINLKGRVEKRMAAMQLAGAEVIDAFTADFNAIANDDELEARQSAKMMRQMEESLDEIDGKKSIGFDDLGFGAQRQLLNDLLAQKAEELENMPNGIFSGFKIEKEPDLQEGMIALLGYPTLKKQNEGLRYTSYELIYIDADGNNISNNQKVILDLLQKYYKKDTFIPTKLEQGDAETVNQLSAMLKAWIEKQAKNTQTDEQGNTTETASQMSLDLLSSLQSGSATAVKKIMQEGSINEKYQIKNFDLIAWLLIS